MAAQTILIAEDDPDIRDGVRILLAGEGYHVILSAILPETIASRAQERAAEEEAVNG